MNLEIIEKHRIFGGTQSIYRHTSTETGTPMQFSLYLPPNAESAPVPLLWYLSGLTCSEENFTVKAGAQRVASETGVAILAPDTSPRGAGIPGEDDSYDFGTAAGFYVDATEVPWSTNYRMYSYLTAELWDIVNSQFPVQRDQQGITGHSMGGHGALVLGLRNPDKFQSISAFAPIVAPSRCPWGQKALTGYLGENKDTWRHYDATALVEDGRRSGEILVDQGDADDFLESQLMPEVFRRACDQAGQALTLRMQEGYDHSYYFIATFIEDHIRFHARRLGVQ